jgi:dTDP-4-amino-4,6-dideoxygalactose transaminase
VIPVQVAIPLGDVQAQAAEVAAEVERGWSEVVARGSFILGEEVAAFEREFADFCGVAHCAGVANGTDALELAARALGVGPGDEVVLPANTFIASALAIARTGATPVLVDPDPETHLLDARALERVGPKTKALMPVHLFGQVAPTEALERAGVPLIEDAAQAQGARRHDEPAGSLGAVAGSSFYPGKNLGAFGDAGAVMTDDDELASRPRALRNYGSEVKYHHPVLGFNSRLDTLQAIVLRAKLRRLAEWNERRREAAGRYDELLEGIDAVRCPVTLPGNEHIWHLYVIRVPARDEVLRRLNTAGIGAGVHYPVPIHLQGAFAHLGHRQGAFPATEAAAREILSLPLYPEITADQQEQVVDRLRGALP